MADLRTALLAHWGSVSSAGSCHEEQSALPRSPRALAQPEGLSQLRGLSMSEAQEAHVPERPRARMSPPSQRQELAEDGLQEMMSLQDLEDSRHLSREFQRLELKMAKKAARQHATDRSESYDSKDKRFRKDKHGLNQRFTRRAASHLDEEISPVQTYAKGEPKSDPTIERSFSQKPDKKHTNATVSPGFRSSRGAADVCVSRPAEPAAGRPHMNPEAPRRRGTSVMPDVGMHDFSQAVARSTRRR